MIDRGSGRSSLQLAALPDGAWFLVPHQAEVRHCQRLLREMKRSPDCIVFITVDTCERAVLGRRPKAWDVDHAYRSVTGSRGTRAFDAAYLAAGGPPLSEQPTD